MHTLDIEGNWSNHRLDPGGKTMFGITERLASKYGLDVRTLTKPQAQFIYRRAFWDPMRLDEVAATNQGEYLGLAMELFEAGVNTGTRRAGGGWHCIVWLQEWLNRFNYRKRWNALSTDGLMGPKTLEALSKYATHRDGQDGAATLMNAINGSQIVYYGNLIDRNPQQFGAFGFGWVRQRGKPITPDTDD